MAFENLTDREKQILQNLIDFYISTADPVGSRAIANQFKMGISSATIRNTLQDLEELGLVQQPHVSAGRVPTDLGYRVYVDSLVKPEELSPQEKELIKRGVFKEGRGINDILGQTCKVLGDITKQLGVTIAPRFEEGILKRIDLIPVNEERIMVVVVVRSGLARSVIIEIESSISETSLGKVESILNERLTGLTLGEIRKTISARLANVPTEGRLIQMVVDSRDKIWHDDRAGDVNVWGADNLVRQPEFSDPSRIMELIKVLGDSAVLSDFLEQAGDEGLVITIGKESKFHEIINCSLVTTSYSVGKISGTIGVVGPTRMPYSKLVSIVNYTARTISDALSGVDPEKE